MNTAIVYSRGLGINFPRPSDILYVGDTALHDKPGGRKPLGAFNFILRASKSIVTYFLDDGGGDSGDFWGLRFQDISILWGVGYLDPVKDHFGFRRSVT